MKLLIALLVLFLGLAAVTYVYARPLWVPVWYQVIGARTVDDVTGRYGPEARRRIEPYFAEAGVAYPPGQVAMLILKEEKRLELWATSDQQSHFIRSYQVTAASGQAGPKLREGDRQVPEGFYDIVGLNPNSAYHLSMKLNYPNAFDLQHAQAEGRDEPGSNIFIHGKSVSIGCVAIGDPAIEELFTLVADAGRENVNVIIAPNDPRISSLIPPDSPDWVAGLYRQIEAEICTNYGSANACKDN